MITITEQYVFPLTSFLDGLAKDSYPNVLFSERENSFCNRHVFSRIAQIPMIVLEVISRIVDLVAGIFCLAIFLTQVVLTLIDDTVDTQWWSGYTVIRLQEGEVILSEIYLRVLRMFSFNPGKICYANARNFSYNDGYASGLNNNFIRWGYRAAQDSNPLVKHLLARVYFTAAIVFGLFARVADLAVAVITVPVSILLLGTNEQLNNIAYRSLKVGAYIRLIAEAAPGIINPENYYKL